jgi:nonsense-mediated mRNA decay protein 3
LGDSNINDPNFEKLDASKIPDVILVRKRYGTKGAGRRLRNWKLKHLAEENTNLNTESK